MDFQIPQCGGRQMVGEKNSKRIDLLAGSAACRQDSKLTVSSRLFRNHHLAERSKMFGVAKEVCFSNGQQFSQNLQLLCLRQHTSLIGGKIAACGSMKALPDDSFKKFELVIIEVQAEALSNERTKTLNVPSSHLFAHCELSGKPTAGQTVPGNCQPARKTASEIG